MTSRLWQHTSCHWDTCCNHSAISDWSVLKEFASNPSQLYVLYIVWTLCVSNAKMMVINKILDVAIISAFLYASFLYLYTYIYELCPDPNKIGHTCSVLDLILWTISKMSIYCDGISSIFLIKRVSLHIYFWKFFNENSLLAITSLGIWFRLVLKVSAKLKIDCKIVIHSTW